MSKIPYRNILVFDTETTGLIPKKENSIEKYPYITQLSFIVYDTLTETVRSSFNTYIKLPPGIEIPNIVTEITGITNEICEHQGIPIQQALGHFYYTMILCDCVIAHNIEFDIQMIQTEIKRNTDSLSLFKNIQSIFHPITRLQLGIHLDCTMRMTTEACALYRTTDKNHTYKKFPKLSETYEFLFQQKPENLHNSMVDALICLRCYLKYRFGILINDNKFNELLSF